MSTIKNKDLKRRIIEISYKHHLSHIGSCLTAVDIINGIYSIKKPDEPFILSSGHAGLALYVVIEKYSYGQDAEDYFLQSGVHPDRKIRPTSFFKGEARNGFYISPINCSTGSLGQGITVAVGMALADRSRDVYCLISDGECAEGSLHEALRTSSELKLMNLKVYYNYNGWAAYRKSTEYVNFGPGVIRIGTDVEQLPFLKGQDAHYHVMTEDEYKLGMEVLR